MGLVPGCRQPNVSSPLMFAMVSSNPVSTTVSITASSPAPLKSRQSRVVLWSDCPLHWLQGFDHGIFNGYPAFLVNLFFLLRATWSIYSHHFLRGIARRRTRSLRSRDSIAYGRSSWLNASKYSAGTEFQHVRCPSSTSSHLKKLKSEWHYVLIPYVRRVIIGRCRVKHGMEYRLNCMQQVLQHVNAAEPWRKDTRANRRRRFIWHGL